MPEAPGQNWDYGHFFKGQIDASQLERAKKNDPYSGEVPTTARDYRGYQKFHEDTMHNALGQAAIFRVTICCEALDVTTGKIMTLPGPKKTHIGASFVFACKHVLCQDTQHPEGIYFWPLQRNGTSGYYVCPSCLRAIERKRYNFGMELQPHCALCMSEKLSEIEKAHPDKLVTLRHKD